MASPTRRVTGAAGALAVVLAVGACRNDDGDDSGGATSERVGPTVATTAGSPTAGSEARAVTVATAAVNSPATDVAAPACDIPDATIADLAGGTISAAVAGLPSLSTLAGAVDAAGLAQRLAGRPAPFTLFAPSDAAFDALDPAARDALLADPVALLDLLARHTVPDAAATLADLAAAKGTASAGAPLVVSTSDGVTVVDAGGQPAIVTCADITVSNGVLHVIDAVLLPPPVDTQAVGGSVLYIVDGETAAVTVVGSFGSELGVLGISATAGGDLVAITDGAELVRFPPTDPAAITSRVPITGVDGATLLAVDTRPGVGELVALSDAGVLYVIEQASGTATPIGAGPLDPPLDDPGFGFDFDTGGEVHVVVATGTNLRVDASSGAVSSAMAPPAFATGDVNDGARPRIVAIASAPTGDPFALDATTSSLARLGDDGILTTIGTLGVSLTDGASLDVAADGTIYLTVPG